MKPNLHIRGFFGPFRFLSNFVAVTVELDDISFPSVEHAYVAAKTTDIELRLKIASIETAARAKTFGRKMKLRDDWNAIKLDVMRDLLMQKFAQEPFRTKLLQTAPMYLEETNTWGDTFWGVCDGIGQNNLGWLLMEIRDSLQAIEVNSELSGDSNVPH